MKITKVPKRKPEVSAEVAQLVGRLAGADDDAALAPMLEAVPQWVWPRGDLYTWVAVLNRFDGALARICRETPLVPVQRAPFAAADRRLLLAVLDFSRLLLENCTNRKLYASYEHLDVLLATDDAEVLEHLLLLLLRPAQQHSGSGRHELSVSHARLGTLASAWPLRDVDGADLLAVARDVPLVAPRSVSTTYFRPGAEDSLGRAAVEVDERTPAALVAPHEGLPADELFDLYTKVRVARSAGDPPARRRALACRLLAVACFAHCEFESAVNQRLFGADPSLLQQCTALLEPAAAVDDGVRAAALYALDSMGHFRARLNEVLGAVNASVSHGLLLQLLHGMTERLRGGVPPLDTYVDALMTLVANLATTVAGSGMVVGAGLVPQLLELARLTSADCFLVQRTSARAVGLLDSAMYAYPPAFQQFVAVRGVDALVAHVAALVRGVLEAPAHGQVLVLRQLLKLFQHLMTTPGTGEGLRNLIDTSLVASLRTIMEHRACFGVPVLALAITIMATFVHNEPTLLGTIQEQRLPEAFIRVIVADVEPSFDLLCAATTAIGALCLNEAGLAQMRAHPVVERLLRVLDAPTHARVLLDRDNANAFGAAVDELVRHHPSLKPAVLAHVFAAVNRLLDEAHAYVPPPAARGVYLLSAGSGAVPTPQPLATSTVRLDEPDHAVPEPAPGDDNRAVTSFDVVCRFLEGLFRNPVPCREFLAAGGLERLLRLYDAPCIAYHFAASTAADSFVTLLRLMADEDAGAVLRALLRSVRASHLALGDDLDVTALVSPAPAALADANVRFRAWVRLNAHAQLLADVVQTFTFSYAGPAVSQALLEAFGTDGALSLAELGVLFRASVHAALCLRACWPEAKRRPPPRVTVETDEAVEPAEFVGGAGVAPGEAASGEAAPGDAPNLGAIYYLATQLPASLHALLAAVVRLMAPRRGAEPAAWRAAENTAEQLVPVLGALGAPAEPHGLALQTYMARVLGDLLYEKRGTLAHTLVLSAWHAHGGVAAWAAAVHALAARAERGVAAGGAGDAAGDETSDAAHAAACLHALLDIALRLVQARPLLDAPATAQLAREQRAFEPHALLIRLRAAVLGALEPLWNAPYLGALPLGIVRATAQALCAVLHADREEPAPRRPEPVPMTLPAIPPLAPVRPPAAQVDEARVAQLVEMGFPRGAARRALERCHNNVSAATEYILGHPALEDEPDEPADATRAEGGGAPGDAPSGTPGAPQDLGDALDAIVAALAPDAAPSSEAPPPPEKGSLDAARNAFRPHFFPRLLALADAHAALVFDARAVFGVLATDAAQTRALFAAVCARADADAGAALGTRLHLVALLLATERVQRELPWDELPTLGRRLVQWIADAAHAREKPTWLSPALLALAGVLSLGAVPEVEASDAARTAYVAEIDRALVAPLLALLAAEHAPETLAAVYRVAVLATRDAASAAALAAPGIAALLRPLRTADPARVAGSPRLAVMVVRHVLEGTALAAHMAGEVRAWYGPNPVPRIADVSTLVKSVGHAALRDPDVFVDAAATQVELAEVHGKQAYVCLREDAPPAADDAGAAAAGAVVAAVLAELAGEHPAPYIFFLLQALCELLSSYNTAKDAFLQQHVRGTPALAYFLTELVPAGFLADYVGDALRERMAVSNWAMSALVALATDPQPAVEATAVPEALVGVRKALLDALCKALRDATAPGSADVLEVRYGRLYALADMCHRLLTAQPHSSTNAPRRTEVVLHMPKTMLEKNFVPVLTGTLADLEPALPSVKALVECVLRPLEYLTKVAIKMARPDRARRAPPPSSDESDADDGDETAPDFYRNSSLGMHTGEMDGAHEMSDVDDDDVEMEEYDSEEGSELSTDAEGLDGDSAHVVEVMDESSNGSSGASQSDDYGSASDYDSESADSWESTDEDVMEEQDYVIDDDADGVDDDADEHVDDLFGALDEDGALDPDDTLDEDDELELADGPMWHDTPADDRFGADWSWLRPRRRHEAPPRFFAPPPGTGAASEAEVRRAPPRTSTHDTDAAFHPLLVEERPSDTDDTPWPRSVEALMGGGTIQFLEMFLNRNAQHGADTSIRIELDRGHGAPHVMNVEAPAGSRAPAAPAAADAPPGPPDTVAEANRFAPQLTAARWGEEARLVFGALAPEVLQRVRQRLVQRLSPQYETRCAAERADTERHAKRKVDEEDRSDTKRKLDVLDEPPADEAPSAPQPRPTITVHGTTVDLTDTGIDPTFLEALPDELREEALLSQQLGDRLPGRFAPDFLDVLPRSLRAELQRVDAPAEAEPPAEPPAEPLAEPPASADTDSGARRPRDAIQLLDRGGIATLVRLLYYTPLGQKLSLLPKVLAQLAENARTRADLLYMLTLVLLDGTVGSNGDRSAPGVSSKAARALSTPQRGAAPAAPAAPAWTPAHVSDEMSHVAAMRSLDLLAYLAQTNEQASLYFLRDDRGKKGRPRAPVQLLLGLLAHDSVLAQAPLLGALLALLSTVTKPLVHVARAEADAPARALVPLGEPHTGVEVPALPAERLADIVRPLRTSISSRAFQHTLAVAAHLVHLDGALDVISGALQRCVNDASAALIEDLDALIAALPAGAAETGAAAAQPLARLASPTSAQAEFLRCLRALDYLYIGK